jgi:hypothetical protein
MLDGLCPIRSRFLARFGARLLKVCPPRRGSPSAACSIRPPLGSPGDFGQSFRRIPSP